MSQLLDDELLKLQRENVRLRRLLEQDYVDRQEHVYQEVRLNDDGSVDEVVANHVFVHVEQMSNKAWWIGINRADGTMLHIDFYSKKRIRATVRDEGFVTPGMYTDYGLTPEPTVSPLLEDTKP